MKLTKMMALVCASLLLTACNDREGDISVGSDLQLRISKKKSEVVPAGEYSAKVIASSKTKVSLDIKINKNKKVKASFNIPKGALEQGQFSLAAEQVGQPYDIVGSRQVLQSTSGTHSDTERCYVSRVENHCGYETTPVRCRVRQECDANNSCREREICTGGDSEYVCRDVDVSIPGTQDVEYEYVTTDDILRIELLIPETDVTAAQFYSEKSKSDKRYTHVGTCHI